MRGSEIFQFPVQRTGMLAQGLKVAVGFIGLALIPTSKVNEHQLMRQGAIRLPGPISAAVLCRFGLTVLGRSS